MLGEAFVFGVAGLLAVVAGGPCLVQELAVLAGALPGLEVTTDSGAGTGIIGRGGLGRVECRSDSLKLVAQARVGDHGAFVHRIFRQLDDHG